MDRNKHDGEESEAGSKDKETAGSKESEAVSRQKEPNEEIKS